MGDQGAPGRSPGYRHGRSFAADQRWTAFPQPALSEKKVDKEYFARIDGRVTERHVEEFAKGVELEDFTTLPAKLEILSSGETSEIRVTIMEGKFHQVKRMFAAFDLHVTYLQRIRMGPLHLDPALKPGEYRELTDEELDMLQNQR